MEFAIKRVWLCVSPGIHFHCRHPDIYSLATVGLEPLFLSLFFSFDIPISVLYLVASHFLVKLARLWLEVWLRLCLGSFIFSRAFIFLGKV